MNSFLLALIWKFHTFYVVFPFRGGKTFIYFIELQSFRQFSVLKIRNLLDSPNNCSSFSLFRYKVGHRAVLSSGLLLSLPYNLAPWMRFFLSLFSFPKVPFYSLETDLSFLCTSRGVLKDYFANLTFNSDLRPQQPRC